MTRSDSRGTRPDGEPDTRAGATRSRGRTRGGVSEGGGSWAGEPRRGAGPVSRAPQEGVLSPVRDGRNEGGRARGALPTLCLTPPSSAVYQDDSDGGPLRLAFGRDAGRGGGRRPLCFLRACSEITP
jgi:hypothetical protein